MSILKKRSTAIVIFIVVVALFSFLGARRSLNRACRQAEAAFFDRSLLKADGAYSAPADHLENCVALTNRLLSVIGKDGPWADAYEAVMTARAALDSALQARDISAAGEANQRLAEAVAQVEAVKAAGAALDNSYDDYDANSAYSDHILSFREDELSAFPANILRHLTGVKAPETFP